VGFSLKFNQLVKMQNTSQSPFYIGQSFFKKKFTFVNGQSSLCEFIGNFFCSTASVFFFLDVGPSIQIWHHAVLYYILFFRNVFTSVGDLPLSPQLNVTVTVDTRPLRVRVVVGMSGYACINV
jgi:hypothetical protein